MTDTCFETIHFFQSRNPANAHGSRTPRRRNAAASATLTPIVAMTTSAARPDAALSACSRLPMRNTARRVAQTKRWSIIRTPERRL